VPVGLSGIVILAFIRITIRPGIMQRLLPLADALAYVHSRLQQLCVEAVAPGEHHWSILRCSTPQASPAISPPMPHIASLALERGACVCSTDHDFARFSGLMHVNPLASG
jgi:predicted nucleic acid-binding protein